MCTSLHHHRPAGGQVDHVKLSMDRGVSWEAATAFKKEMEDRLEEAEPGRTHKSGFYTQRGKTTMLNGQREQQGVPGKQLALIGGGQHRQGLWSGQAQSR